MSDPFSIVLGGGRGMSKGNDLVAGLEDEQSARQADVLLARLAQGECEAALAVLKLATHETGSRTRSSHLDRIDNAYRKAVMKKALDNSGLAKRLWGLLMILDIRSSEADYLVVDEGVMHIAVQSEVEVEDLPYLDDFALRCGNGLSKKSSSWTMASRGQWKNLPEDIMRCHDCEAHAHLCYETLEDKQYPLLGAPDESKFMQTFDTAASTTINDLLRKEDSKQEQIQDAVERAYVLCFPEMIARMLATGGERALVGALSYEVYSLLRDTTWRVNSKQMRASITRQQWYDFAHKAVFARILEEGDMTNARWDLRDTIIKNCKSVDA